MSLCLVFSIQINSCFLLSLSNLQTIHFSDISIIKIMNKVFAQESAIYRKGSNFISFGNQNYTGWPCFFFFFSLSQGVKCCFFQTESDVHLPMRTIGQDVSFVPMHLIAVFVLALLLKSQKRYSFSVGHCVHPWFCLETALNSRGVIDLWILSHEISLTDIFPPSISAVHPSSSLFYWFFSIVAIVLLLVWTL